MGNSEFGHSLMEIYPFGIAWFKSWMNSRHKQTGRELMVDHWIDLACVQTKLKTRKASGVLQMQHAREEYKIFRGYDELRDSAIILDLVNSCAKQKNLLRGRIVYMNVRNRGLLKKNIYVATALLHMFIKCGALAEAQEVFGEHPRRDTISWTVLISGYVQQGLSLDALKCFEQMKDEGFSPNTVTYLVILKACGNLRAVARGEEIHAEIKSQELLGKDIMLGTAVVDMYAKSGVLAKAQEVFDELPSRNLITWTTLIAGYAQQGFGNEALRCFRQMQADGFSPDAFTFACVLKACGIVGAAEEGEKIHAEVSRQGLLAKDAVLHTAVMDMYMKCGAFARAEEVFDRLPIQSIVSWNVLIAGYAQHGQGDKALRLFEQMCDKGFSPSVVTFICLLKACGSIGAADKGEVIHAEISKWGLLERDAMIGNALVDMYGKCGFLLKAQ